jgi:hypothetical protein
MFDAEKRTALQNVLVHLERHHLLSVSLEAQPDDRVRAFATNRRVEGYGLHLRFHSEDRRTQTTLQLFLSNQFSKDKKPLDENEFF